MTSNKENQRCCPQSNLDWEGRSSDGVHGPQNKIELFKNIEGIISDEESSGSTSLGFICEECWGDFSNACDCGHLDCCGCWEGCRSTRNITLEDDWNQIEDMIDEWKTYPDAP